MARLILINGAPGSGKSTLARRYVRDRPLALALDLDVVRGMLGAPLSGEAGLVTRELAAAVLDVQLRAGRDAVVPQYLGRPDFVLALAGIAHDAGAEFVETAVLLDPATAAARYEHRAGHPLHGMDRDDAPPPWLRPGTRTVRLDGLDPERAYAAWLDLL